MRKHHNAAQVKLVRTVLFSPGHLLLQAFVFTEVAHEMKPVGLAFAEHVKQEVDDLFGQVLVVEKQTRDKAQVFGVDPLLLGVDFKHGHSIVSVNLVAGRTSDFAPH